MTNTYQNHIIGDVTRKRSQNKQIGHIWRDIFYPPASQKVLRIHLWNFTQPLVTPNMEWCESLVLIRQTATEFTNKRFCVETLKTYIKNCAEVHSFMISWILIMNKNWILSEEMSKVVVLLNPSLRRLHIWLIFQERLIFFQDNLVFYIDSFLYWIKMGPG